jgi:tRNA nucleotidyltransferase (CCA-adding enzyme)
MTFPDSIAVPTSVVEIVQRLEDSGYETWCVGGAIRDALLDNPHTDFDIATSAPPDMVTSLFRHTVPVGIKYGTVGVLDSDRVLHEVTTFRRDVRTDGRHAEVEFGATLEEDLARRDFTINAMAYHPLRQEWRDPHAGQEDLDRHVVRAVGDPADRFREDRLRILRALRLAARFGFQIEAFTWRAARAEVAGIRDLSAERVRDEWYKGLRTAKSITRFVKEWIRVGAAEIWLPELIPPPKGEVAETGRWRRLGGSDAVDGAPESTEIERGDVRDPVVLTVLLCLDPVAVLRRLKASNSEIQRATAMMTGPLQPDGADQTSVRRWMAAVGDASNDLARVWTLRHQASWPWEALMQRVRDRGDPLTRADLAVTGDDLTEAGIAPGPTLGECLETLLAAVVEDPSRNTREQLLALAKESVDLA